MNTTEQMREREIRAILDEAYNRNDLGENWAVAELMSLLSQDRQRFKVEMENKYENCPQCTGLRDEYKANLKKAIEGMEPVLTKKVGGLEGYREEQLINKAHILALPELN